jgi:lipoprotein-releasing system ATP-binding protein
VLKGINIHKSYNGLEILKGISLEIQKAEIVSIVGSSGAGKTTLLQILGTLDKADQGSIEVDGVNPSSFSKKELSKFRNTQLGFIFQFHQLLPEFNAIENVCMPGLIGNRNKKEVQEEAKQLLFDLGLEHRMTHKPSQLSGGEQQRVAVARALINNAPYIFADEPSGNLDSENSKELHELFFKLREERGQAFIIVTHNKELAELSDRTILLKDGLVIE